jgi:hypothetical protein
MNDNYGNPTLETIALRTIRQLIREGVASPGARLTLTVPSKIMDWLDSCPFDWKSRLDDRIGKRYNILVGESIEIKADR